MISAGGLKIRLSVAAGVPGPSIRPGSDFGSRHRDDWQGAVRGGVDRHAPDNLGATPRELATTELAAIATFTLKAISRHHIA